MLLLDSTLQAVHNDRGVFGWVVAFHQVPHAEHKNVCSRIMQPWLQMAGCRQG
jgi:hypothetical protein